LIESFSEFKDSKNIDRATLMSIMEDVFRAMVRKKYGEGNNVDVVINTEKGDVEMYRNRTIVEDGMVEDENTQIALSDALKIESDFEVGEDVTEQIHLEDFGRRAVLSARQNLVARIMELEKDELFRRYNERVGELIAGEVSQVLKKDIFVLDDATSNELLLPKNEMIKGDFYRKGDTVRAVVKRVDMRNNNPVVVLSRTDNMFLEKLLEQEVPEIEDGLITVRKIVRIPGERAKVAVESYDDRIDPVGACVGMKGSRIHGIVRELRNENIDIINYTNNAALYIQRALTPAKNGKVEINAEKMRAEVSLPPDQVSLAIGKGGTNIKLASQLSGYEIDVYRDDADVEIDDVDLDEFRDEIDEWILDALKSIGCDTARSVLDLSKQELLRRTDLEEETVDELLRILAAEFDEE
ncbi:MAG: transcription termination/antitermination protein NusA, partial [Saprospiraceae bacterium]|nr:transcription termination/antitermination protein NusA [Saprospiraceae bacterium]